MMQVDLAQKAEGLCSLWRPRPAAPRSLSAWRASTRKTSKPKAKNKITSKSTATSSRNGTTPASWCTPDTSSACRGIPKTQVAEDIRFLMDEVGPDQASFFMLTPLPGSHDHREMKKRGEWMDPDFNKRDSFHATIKHPLMTRRGMDRSL